MREPAIHISKSALNNLIEEWFDRHKISKSSDLLVDYLLKNGVRYTLTHRKKLDNYNNGTKRHSFQLQSATVGDAKLFAGLLTQIRVQKKHRGISTIREGTSEWSTLKECTGKANAFCEAYNIDARSGFIQYINLYFQYLETNRAKFNLKAMPSKHELICNLYEANKEIEQDVDPEKTKTAHNVYSHLVSERTGIPIDYSKEPLKYVYFTYVSKLAKGFGLSVQQYIKAQFEALDWTNGIPAPAQLVTKNAEERTVKWMSENSIKVSRGRDVNNMTKEEMNNFWAKIKRHEDSNIE